MATEVSFQAVSREEDKNRQIALLAETFYQQNKRVFIWTEKQQTSILNRELWTFRPASFLPHAVWPCSVALHPIILSHLQLKLDGADVLIVANPQEREQFIPWMQRYPMVIDFANLDTADGKEYSRRCYKTWREAGMNPRFEKEAAQPQENS